MKRFKSATILVYDNDTSYRMAIHCVEMQMLRTISIINRSSSLTSDAKHTVITDTEK